MRFTAIKKYKKVCEKVWIIRNKLYLCTRNQENNDVQLDAAKVLKKKRFKKVHQKFGGLNFLLYLCTTFRSENLEYESLRKWFFDLLVFYIERKV